MSKERHLFEKEIFCDAINAFTLTFKQFNESLNSLLIQTFGSVFLTHSYVNDFMCYNSPITIQTAKRIHVGPSNCIMR